MRRSSYTRTLTASVVAAALVGTGVTGAVASEDPAEATANLIADVAPDQGQVVAGTESGGEVTAQVDQSVAVVPLDADQPVVLGGTEGQAPNLELNLPRELDVHYGQVASDGTVVYQQNGGDAAAAVQVLDDGAVRVQTITPDADGPHEFTYTFGEGITPLENEDGTIDLVQDLGAGVSVSLVTIAQPWAVDADGSTLRTEYRIDGNSLVQVVTADANTSYPIVADPSFSLGNGYYAHFDKAETKAIANGSYGIATITGICAAAGKKLGYAGIFGSICAAITTAIVAKASVANNRGKCVYARYYISLGAPAPVFVKPNYVVGEYKDSRCK